MMATKVKICGITCRKDLNTAINAGADAVGFVVNVPSSPRNLSLKDVERLLCLVPIFVSRVIVTVPHDTNSLIESCERLDSDAVQIHGDSKLDLSVVHKKFPRLKLIRALHVKKNEKVEEVIKTAIPFDGLLIDTFVQNGFGGSGKVHDWEQTKLIREAYYPKPLILAGGLKPENVISAIKVVKPYAVDVSSGVESVAGKKDPEKIFRFIKNAKGV